MKINRYLAGCGLGSRRKCEELAASGRVRINGKTVVKLATEVSNDDYVTVDGKAVTIARTVTLMLHKPKGYICTKREKNRFRFARRKIQKRQTVLRRKIGLQYRRIAYSDDGRNFGE